MTTATTDRPAKPSVWPSGPSKKKTKASGGKKARIGKKTRKNRKPKGTSDLPMSGEKEAKKQTGLDGSTIREKPDPKSVAAARKYAESLESIEDAKLTANEEAANLLDVLKKSKKKQLVEVLTDRRKYIFTVESLSRLTTKKQNAVN